MKTSTDTKEPDISKQKEYLELAEKYSRAHPDFKPYFINSLRKDFDGYGYLTEPQFSALNNLVVRFRMLRWAKESENGTR